MPIRPARPPASLRGRSARFRRRRAAAEGERATLTAAAAAAARRQLMGVVTQSLQFVPQDAKRPDGAVVVVRRWGITVVVADHGVVVCAASDVIVVNFTGLG